MMARGMIRRQRRREAGSQAGGRVGSRSERQGWKRETLTGPEAGATIDVSGPRAEVCVAESGPSRRSGHRAEHAMTMWRAKRGRGCLSCVVSGAGAR